MSSRRSEGNFRDWKNEDILIIQPKDFANPWNLFMLFTRPEVEVHQWCRSSGLLATSFPCLYDDCNGQMSPKIMTRPPGGSFYRCTKNRYHTRASRTNSFFEIRNVLIQDTMFFYKVIETSVPCPMWQIFCNGIRHNSSSLGCVTSFVREFSRSISIGN